VANSYAQEKRITIDGIIQSEEIEEIELEDIHIFNKNSRKGTISHANGEFEIDVKENDTLLFTGIQFYSREVPITKIVIQQKKLFTVLFLRINELREIELREHNLDGTLLTDSNKAPDSVSKISTKVSGPWEVDFNVVDDYDAVDRVRPPDAASLTNPNIPVGGNILGLVSFITKPIVQGIKDLREDRRKSKYLDRVYEQQTSEALVNIEKEFGEDFFIKTLKIPKLQIEPFLKHCESLGIIDLYLTDKKIEVIDLMLKERENYVLNN
jgi:hypothetical protein